MMGWRRVQACSRPSSRCARATRVRSSSRSRLRPPIRAAHLPHKSTKSFASRRLAHFAASERGTPIFGKSPTKRCASTYSGQTMPPEVSIEADGKRLAATLTESVQARGLVIFAHGSGSSRHSARNIFVAEQLNERGFSTLLLDLLTPSEDRIDRVTAELRFDIELLATRVERASAWAETDPRLRSLAQGYFGASTGAAAALVAASVRPSVRAVVSRGGRPDLAGAALPYVQAATLLLVGGNDPVVLQLNEEAKRRMRAVCELIVILGAGHLFEEAGALEAVAKRAGDWFERHL